jgi:hypothetical protein
MIYLIRRDGRLTVEHDWYICGLFSGPRSWMAASRTEPARQYRPAADAARSGSDYPMLIGDRSA